MIVCLLGCHRKVRVVGELSPQPLEQLLQRLPVLSNAYLDRPLQLLVHGQIVTASYRDLGYFIDEKRLVQTVENLSNAGMKDRIFEQLEGVGRDRVIAFPIEIDVEKATEFLLRLKSEVDLLAVEGHLNADNTVTPSQPGFLLQVIDSLVVLKYEARRMSGRGEEKPIALRGVDIVPSFRFVGLGQDDFKVVLGWWETRYPNAGGADSNRTGNLKLGATKVDGTIIDPGQIFSFNQTVGERTERAGFKVAPEIGGAEMVDGVGGGMCQLSSTLHAAAFFAGLEILETKPHSRPSAYIPAGLDSTVVYPTLGHPKGTDLKIRNPFSFPLLVRYSVGQGWVRVKIWGKERPYERVEFHREVLSVLPYSSTPIKRLDPKMPLGQVVDDQAGHVGYRIRRTRCIMKKGETEMVCPEKGNKDHIWDVTYNAVDRIIREGSGPSTLKPIRPPSPHYVTGIKDPKAMFVLSQ